MTEEETQRFLSLVNMHMQGTYSMALGSSPRAYEISEKLGRGLRYAICTAFEDMKADAS